MKREVGDYLADIVEAMVNAQKFVEGMSFADFCRDTKTVYAVVRAIEIIGEAVKNIPDDFRARYPDIPWRSMAGMRDKLAHGYFSIRLERVWEVLQKDIPDLKPKFEAMLAQFPK
ncbi:MAG: DUF86 domain-containing protein [Anaerolineae bacterium]|nr:DUF86 domain-containing protein [Anaerolineae bacterium]MCX8067387.1 DUF86 domain-containing protein [Anaerolineae bacterium]MDW7991865.1 DUF86 domain-containing protein [Anaerolineae bacterium]